MTENVFRMKAFTQEQYSKLVRSLDEAMEVWRDLGKDEENAQVAMRDFINCHYFRVWRAING